MSSNSPFGKLGLNSHICHAVKKFGIELPSPIQRKLIPAILNSDKNIIATARTGSGKTLAYLLPILHKLEAHSTIVGIRALIICPTRELVLQVSGVLKKLISFLSDFRICHLVGGMSLSKEFEHLLINPDIVIGTPGRLNYHITNTKIEFSRLEYLILDEADLLVDLNLEYEFNELSKSLKGLSIQRILVSATIPQKLLEFIKTEFDDPICVQLDESKRLNPNLSMNFVFTTESNKITCLAIWLKHLLSSKEQAIVFCSTSHAVTFIGEMLSQFKISNILLTGTLTQKERTENLQSFRNKEISVLVGTDLVARGLDIPNIAYVINFSMPSSPRLFIHRAGRTARKNETGTVISILDYGDMCYLFDLSVYCGLGFEFFKEEYLDSQKNSISFQA
uniref:RNA helicase n=1 Tax=Dermatophagoides pteronyssinus TaxID=6956 RepID=A0A6P6XJS0_DERPT|nr:ATP-dependent RNA helicase DBP10-like [Dermatophagoides pteronyssinus]